MREIMLIIKLQGGIEYKGAKSFLIAKSNSIKQESFWCDVLKEKYDSEVSAQFKYDKCIFDFINIPTNTIYECKLSLNDFNDEQYEKYLLTLNKYKIIYLICEDAVVDIENKCIYTIHESKGKYDKYLEKLKTMNESKQSFLDKMMVSCGEIVFNIIELENFNELKKKI